MKTTSLKNRLLHVFFSLVIILSGCSSPFTAAKPTETLTFLPLPTSSVPPTLTPTVPPTTTPVPPIYLSQLTPVFETVGYGSLGVGVYAMPGDPGHNGRILQTHHQMFLNGLLAHAPSRIDYTLDGKYGLFQTQILMQEDVSCGDGTTFKVFLDGREVFSAPVLPASEPQQVELNVTGIKMLSLVVDINQTNDCDWSIWGDPKLIPTAEVAANYPTATSFPTLIPNPNLPCGGSMPESIYLFLDCNDIRRIRSDLNSFDPDFLQAWNSMVNIVDTYRSNFPTSYNIEGDPVIWWGSSNYIARDMALIYLVTGDLGYANDEIRLLELVISRTPVGQWLVTPKHGEVVYQSVLFGYLAVRDLPSVSVEKRAQYDRFFISQAQMLEADSSSQGKIPLNSWINRNVPMGENTAAATIALALPNSPEAQRLYVQARSRLEWMLSNWFEADGGWGENTNWYGHRVLEGVLNLAETIYKMRGENIYDTDFGGRSIHNMCTYFLKSITPEGDPPQINDTGWFWFDPGILMLCGQRTNDTSLIFGAKQYLWGFYNAYHNGGGLFTPFETVAWWDPRVTQILPSPDWTSALLPSTGLGIFRSNWTHDAQYGLLKYTSSAVHNHYSFGEFFLYDYGPWLVGNGYHLGAQYNTSINTTSSSTLTLDNSQQTTIGGKLIAFEPLGQTGYMAVTSPSYSILTHTRHVLWNQTWHQWIVVDDASMNSSPSGHTIQVRWFVRGQEVSHDNQGQWTYTRTGYPGFLTIQLPSPFKATYSAISRSFTLFTGLGDAVGVKMEVSPTSADTRLVSLLTYTSGKPASYPSLSRDDSGQGLLVTTQPESNSPTWDWLLPSPGKTEADSGGYSLTGAAGCAWMQSGFLSGYCLYSGSAFNQGDTTLVKSDQAVSVETDLEHNTIKLDAPTNTLLELYWPAPVSKTSMDGSPLTYSLNNNQLSIQVPMGEHTIVINP
jgi:hypothetical protein